MVKEIAISEDEVQSHFLRARLARLSIFQILGTLERWIKHRINEAPDSELNRTERDLWIKLTEDIKAETGSLYYSGKLKDRLFEHPLHKLIEVEIVRREKELEAKDPKSYYGPFYDLSGEELKDFFEWKSANHRGEVFRSTKGWDVIPIEEWISMWRKDKRKSLVVLKGRNETKEVKTDNRRLSIPGEGIYSSGSDLQSSSKGRLKTPIKGESKAYGPRRKR